MPSYELSFVPADRGRERPEAIGGAGRFGASYAIVSSLVRGSRSLSTG